MPINHDYLMRLVRLIKHSLKTSFDFSSSLFFSSPFLIAFNISSVSMLNTPITINSTDMSADPTATPRPIFATYRMFAPNINPIIVKVTQQYRRRKEALPRNPGNEPC